MTADKIYAVYAVPDKKTVLEYTCQVGLAADRVAEVKQSLIRQPKIKTHLFLKR